MGFASSGGPLPGGHAGAARHAILALDADCVSYDATDVSRFEEITGIHPGVVSDALLFALTSLAQRIDSISAAELLDCCRTSTASC